MMRELSLFSGAGGGLLGTHLLGWRPIGYVEFNDYCQRVIRARIDDGILPEAPIYGDVRTFIREGYAASYTGMADVITAGFPCQPFSQAGKRRGEDDDRNMWPATIECIRVVRPRFCLLENVPGLISSGYFGTILGDLAESGYDARWRILSAAEMGAPHQRDRLWIIATDANRSIEGGWQQSQRGSKRRDTEPTRNGEGGSVAHAAICQPNGGRDWTRRRGMGKNEPELYTGDGQWWQAEPDVGGTFDGLARWLDVFGTAGLGGVL